MKLLIPFRLLVTGSRTWPERILLYKHLDVALAETLYMDRELIIVQGDCK
jgi:hypothetical protein